MHTLHTGRGHTRGAMTVFPLWTESTGRGRYSLSPRSLDLSELETGPDVNTLMVGNVGDRPALVLEGQLFEGGLQHRMATRSMMIGVHQRIPIEVACVEQGRWAGGRAQHTRGRRATPYIREAVRGRSVETDLQGEVWRRVARHTAGTDNPTDSFVRRLDEAAGDRRGDVVDWSDYRVLPGQSGVLIGIGGQPYVAEVFSDPLALRRQVGAVLAAAALDAVDAPREHTPGRRARRFADRVARTVLDSRRPAGVAEEMRGRSTYLDVSLLRWQERTVHGRMTNVRHPMLVG